MLFIACCTALLLHDGCAIVLSPGVHAFVVGFHDFCPVTTVRKLQRGEQMSSSANLQPKPLNPKPASPVTPNIPHPAALNPHTAVEGEHDDDYSDI